MLLLRMTIRKKKWFTGFTKLTGISLSNEWWCKQEISNPCKEIVFLQSMKSISSDPSSVCDLLTLTVLRHTLQSGTTSGQKQFFCKVRIFNDSPSKIFCNRLDINFALFISLTLNFPKWPWVNILINPQVLCYLCLKYELSMFLQKIDFSLFFPVTLNLQKKWPMLKTRTYL